MIKSLYLLRWLTALYEYNETILCILKFGKIFKKGVFFKMESEQEHSSVISPSSSQGTSSQLIEGCRKTAINCIRMYWLLLFAIFVYIITLIVFSVQGGFVFGQGWGDISGLIAGLVIGSIFFLVWVIGNFVCTIQMIVRTDALCQYNKEYRVIFIMASVSIVIAIYSLIAAILLLRRIKKINKI